MTFDAFQTAPATTPNTVVQTTSSVLYNLQWVGPKVPSLWVQDQLNRAANVQRYRRYAIGDQDAFLSPEMRALLGVTSTNYSPFADNYQDVVIQSFVDRCLLQAIQAPGNDAGSEYFDNFYEYARLDGLQSDIHEAAIRDGDTFAMVTWDEETQQNKVTLEEAYDGNIGMLAFYRSKSIPIMDCAIKIWQIALDITMNVLTRVNIYFPDHVEKYYGINNAPLSPWQGGDISIPEYKPESQTITAVVPSSGGIKSIGAVSKPTPSAVIHFEPEEPIQYYKNRDGSPLGIPVFHFRNRGRQNYGYSEIKSSIPIQDALNRIMYSLVINAEYNGFNILWTRGFQAPSAIRPGTIIEISKDQPMTTDQVADVGRLEAGNMSPFIDTAKWLTGEIGKITRTPTNEFSQDAGKVSGESLKMREIGLIGKANRFMTKAGNVWEDIFMYAARVEAAYGNKMPPKIETAKAIWRSAEIRDDTQIVQNAMLLRPVVGDAQTLRMVSPVLDIDESGIQEILDEKQQETADKLAAMAAVPQFGAFQQPGEPTPSGGNVTPMQNGMNQTAPGSTASAEQQSQLEAPTKGVQEVTQ